MGNTEVLCAASVESRVPPTLRDSGMGWVTAEYCVLPSDAYEHEAVRGKQSGRTRETQSLVGRAPRAPPATQHCLLLDTRR
jgi:ribonuclease PH